MYRTSGRVSLGGRKVTTGILTLGIPTLGIPTLEQHDRGNRYKHAIAVNMTRMLTSPCSRCGRCRSPSASHPVPMHVPETPKPQHQPGLRQSAVGFHILSWNWVVSLTQSADNRKCTSSRDIPSSNSNRDTTVQGLHSTVSPSRALTTAISPTPSSKPATLLPARRPRPPPILGLSHPRTRLLLDHRLPPTPPV